MNSRDGVPTSCPSFVLIKLIKTDKIFTINLHPPPVHVCRNVFLLKLSSFVVSINRATNYILLNWQPISRDGNPMGITSSFPDHLRCSQCSAQRWVDGGAVLRVFWCTMECGNCVRAHKHHRRLLITHSVIGFLTSAFARKPWMPPKRLLR